MKLLSFHISLSAKVYKREHGEINGLTPSEMFLQTFNRSHNRNNTKAITTAIEKRLSIPTNGYVSIERQLKPSLIKIFENDTSLKWLNS